MARCSYCGSSILFGGKKLDGLTFCGSKCLSHGKVLIAARTIPDELISNQALKVHAGACPVCKERRGPIDVYTSHKVSSFIFMTSWSSQPRVSCRSCGTKAQLGAVLYSLLLGWWGVPWGLLMTPVQVIKNLAGMLRKEQSMQPSEQLKQIVRHNIAAQTLAAEQQFGR